jgi:hypothetical protein
MKVQILTRCDSCNGEAYIVAGVLDDFKGGTYPTYTPCPSCQGTGQHPKWLASTSSKLCFRTSALINPAPMKAVITSQPLKRGTISKRSGLTAERTSTNYPWVKMVHLSIAAPPYINFLVFQFPALDHPEHLC